MNAYHHVQNFILNTTINQVFGYPVVILLINPLFSETETEQHYNTCFLFLLNQQNMAKFKMC